MSKNKLDLQYQDLVIDIMANGFDKGDRTGTGTVSVFGRQIRHNMKDGFPLLTTKKMSLKNIATELIWFLRGDTNIKYLVDNGCMIWVGDAYKNYCKKYCTLIDVDKIKYGSSHYNHELNEYNFELLSQEEFIDKIKTDDEFTKTWGELGPVYGKQWRKWYNDNLFFGSDILRGYTDQIKNALDDLKNNPDSRRIIVNSWNVGEIDDMVLPPCHNMFQFYTRELSLDERKDIRDKNNFSQDMSWYNMESSDIIDLLNEDNIPSRAISLMWNQRSVDTGLGLPYNIASYGLLLEIIAKMVNMVPEEIIGNLGDTHLYNNHIEPIQEQLSREPFELPKLKFSEWFNNSISEKQHEVVLDDWFESLKPEDFILENYQSYSKIELPLSN